MVPSEIILADSQKSKNYKCLHEFENGSKRYIKKLYLTCFVFSPYIKQQKNICLKPP